MQVCVFHVGATTVQYSAGVHCMLKSVHYEIQKNLLQCNNTLHRKQENTI